MVRALFFWGEENGRMEKWKNGIVEWMSIRDFVNDNLSLENDVDFRKRICNSWLTLFQQSIFPVFQRCNDIKPSINLKPHPFKWDIFYICEMFNRLVGSNKLLIIRHLKSYKYGN